jgi:hypothetical protein
VRIDFIGTSQPFPYVRLEEGFQLECQIFAWAKFFPQVNQAGSTLVESENDVGFCTGRRLIQDLQFGEEQG